MRYTDTLKVTLLTSTGQRTKRVTYVEAATPLPRISLTVTSTTQPQEICQEGLASRLVLTTLQAHYLTSTVMRPATIRLSVLTTQLLNKMGPIRVEALPRKQTSSDTKAVESFKGSVSPPPQSSNKRSLAMLKHFLIN